MSNQLREERGQAIVLVHYEQRVGHRRDDQVKHPVALMQFLLHAFARGYVVDDALVADDCLLVGTQLYH